MRPAGVAALGRGEVGVAAAAEQDGDPVGAGADGPAELVNPPGGQVALDAGDADGAAAGAVMTEEGGPGAEDALGIFLVVDGETAAAGPGQVGEQGVNVGDGVRGAGPQAGLLAQ